MADVASLSIRADSTQVTRAKAALDALANSSTKLTRVTEGTQRDFVRVSKAAESYTQRVRTAEMATDALANTSRRATRGSFKPMGGAVQQMGYQIGDFAVQVGAGQSALVAFSQQGSQMAGVFGPGGAVLGAVLAVGAALGGAFMRGAEDAAGGAETLIERIRELELAYEDLTSAQRVQLMLDFESEQQKRESRMASVRSEIERLTEIQERYNQQLENTRSAESQIFTSGPAPTQRISQQDAESASREALELQARLDALQQEADQAREGMENLAFGFGDASDEADKMASEVEQMVRALEEQAAAIGETNRQTTLRIAIESQATEQQIASINASYDALEAEEQRLEFNKAMTQWAQKRRQEMEREAAAQEKYIQGLRDAIDPMGRFEREATKIREAFAAGELGNLGRDQVEAYIQSIKPAVDATEEEFSKAADRIGQTLQDSIASGDWEGLGATVGGALAGGIGAKVANSVGGDIIGPLAGGLAGGIVGLAVSEALDYVSQVDDPTERRQGRQGTGTVLGSIDDKSESIQNAVEHIESTNSELVDINTGMLAALQTLQSGIAGASGGAARAAAGIDPDMSFDQPGFIDELNDNLFIGDWFGDVFGGDSKLVGQGIQLMGGALTDLASDTLNEALVSAYSTVAKKKHLFDDYDNSEQVTALSDNVQRQFAGVFGGIAETVMEGAEALGLAPESIQDDLDNFVVDMQKISLEGLSADERAAEIEAVFSSIFDEAVTTAVPFIEQFQQAGEGLGETLARVATEVQLMDEAVETLGFRMTATSSEWIARHSDRLVELSGGIEQFSNNLVGFERNFISASAAFESNSRRLEEALGGLPLPETRQGFVDLLQAQNASTQSGAENIATLLKLQETANDYYDALDKQQDEALQGLREAIGVRREDLRDIYQDQIELIRESAEAQLEANQLALDAAKSGLSAISEEVSGLVKAADSLRESYEPIQELRRSTALDRLSRALQSGDLTGVGEAAGVAANIGTSSFSTAVEFRRAQATTLSLLSQLEREGMDQQTTAEMAVERLESQTDAINEQTERQLEQAEEAYNGEIERLDRIYDQQVEAVNASRGIETGVLSINEALRGIANTLGVESVPGFASGGYHSGGMRVVGERGPELEFTGPSRVMSNSDSRRLLNMDELIREVRELRDTVNNGNRAVAKATGKTAKYLERWDLDGLPESRETV